MQLRRVALVHASATPGGGADRVTEHVVGVRNVTRIDAGPMGVTVTVYGQPRIWVPLSNVRWGEMVEEPPAELTPVTPIGAAVGAALGGKRGKR